MQKSLEKLPSKMLREPLGEILKKPLENYPEKLRMKSTMNYGSHFVKNSKENPEINSCESLERNSQ